MGWITPQHKRWLAACVAVLLLSVWAGGPSLSLAAIVAIVFAAGAALLSVDFPAPVVPDLDPSEDLSAPVLAETVDDADAGGDSADAAGPVSVA